MTASWSPEVLNQAIVSKLRELLGITSCQVVLGTTPDTGYVLVQHVSDAWGLPIEGSCPGHDGIADLAPRLRVPDDATDLVVVDWLTDQGNRRGSTIMLLTKGNGVRLAPVDDSGAFAGEAHLWADWILTPGSPHAFVPLCTADRVAELAKRASDIEEVFYEWLERLDDETGSGYCTWAQQTFEQRLDELLAGRVRV